MNQINSFCAQHESNQFILCATVEFMMKYFSIKTGNKLSISSFQIQTLVKILKEDQEPRSRNQEQNSKEHISKVRILLLLYRARMRVQDTKRGPRSRNQEQNSKEHIR